VETVNCQQSFDDRVRRLCEAIDAGSAARFVAEFDALALRQTPLPPQRQQQILQWVNAHLRRPEVVGLERHRLAGLTAIGPNFCQARWQWPDPRFSDECLLAVCACPPASSSAANSSAPDSFTPDSSTPDSSTPDSSTPVSSTPDSSTPVSSAPTESEAVSAEPLAAVFTASIRRHEQVQRGTAPCLHWPRAWHGHQVVVSAVLDLGFARVLTEPISLGELNDWTKSSWLRGMTFGTRGLLGRCREGLARWLPHRSARPNPVQPWHYHGD
jgi:hypothetical protein